MVVHLSLVIEVCFFFFFFDIESFVFSIPWKMSLSMTFWFKITSNFYFFLSIYQKKKKKVFHDELPLPKNKIKIRRWFAFCTSSNELKGTESC